MKIALFIIFTVITFCFTQRTLTDADRQRIVSSMNSFRASTTTFSPLPVAGSMKTITWDPNLENLARAYAAKCTWGHSPCGGAGQRSCMTGENLYFYATSAAAPSTTFVIDNSHTSWTNEYKFYDYNANTCQTGQQCGHYTVIVKDSNYGVGCAIIDCPTMTGITFSGNKIYMVCNYNGQNIGGVRPYTAAAGSTQAPTTKPPTTLPPTTRPPTATTLPPTGTTLPPTNVQWQPVAFNILTKINAYKRGLGHQPYLVNNKILAHLQDFTKRQAAAGNFLATEISPFYQANRMGGAWCYTNCRASTCNEDVIYNFLTTSKLAQVQNVAYLYFEIAYADNAAGTRFWTVFWHTSSGNVLDANTSEDNTLEEDEEH